MRSQPDGGVEAVVRAMLDPVPDHAGETCAVMNAATCLSESSRVVW
jgi:hypothetical protein